MNNLIIPTLDVTFMQLKLGNYACSQSHILMYDEYYFLTKLADLFNWVQLDYGKRNTIPKYW